MYKKWVRNDFFLQLKIKNAKGQGLTFAQTLHISTQGKNDVTQILVFSEPPLLRIRLPH